MIEETKFIKINKEETIFAATYRHLVQDYEGNLGWYDDVTHEFCPILDGPLKEMKIIEFIAIAYEPDDCPFAVRKVFLGKYPAVEMAEKRLFEQLSLCESDKAYGEVRKIDGNDLYEVVRAFSKKEVITKEGHE